jgi:hypothetical protein
MKLARIIWAMAISCTLASSVLAATSQDGDQLINPMQWGNDDWGFTRAVTAEGDFLRWLGSLRLNTAKAAYADALAAEQYARAAAIQRTVNALTTDLTRIDRYINGVNSSLAEMSRRLRSLNGLTAGYVSARSLSAVNYFMNLLPQEVIELLLLAESAVPAIAATDFELRSPTRGVLNEETGEVEQVQVIVNDFAGGNVFAFIGWLRNYDMKAVLGSPGHTELLKLRGHLRAGADKWYESVMTQRRGYEEQKLDVWGPVYGGGFSLPERQLPE